MMPPKLNLGPKIAFMLEAIRKRSAGIVVKGLLGLLILSFAAWGVADVFTPGGTNRTLASVGGIDIQPDQVQREYTSEIQRLSNVFGTQIDDDQARLMGIGRSVVRRIAERTLYDLGAKDLGLIATDDLVRRSIREMPAFKNAGGQFEAARFQQVIQNNRLTEAGFVELTRGDITRTQYLSMLRTALAPKELSEMLYAFRNEKRIAETVTIKYDTITLIPEPDEAALEKFHKENAKLYTAPEYRQLSFISLKASDLAKEMAVSDDAIQRAYDERLGDFSDPEKRNLLQIRFSDEKAATEAYDRLKTGDDFFKVAKELADMDPDQTELGNMKQTELMPGLSEPAFSLEVEGFTPPLKSVLGWHILKLKEIKPPRQLPLSEVKEDLKKGLAAELAIESLYSLANKLEDELGGGATLEEAARAMDLTVRKQGEIDALGFTPTGAKAEELPGGNFLEVAFSTDIGTESVLTEAGDDGYFIVRVDAATEPQLKPLADVRNDVIAAWKADKTREFARQQAESLVDELTSGGDLTALATAKGLNVTTTQPLGRNGVGSNLTRELVTDLFEIKVGETAFGPGQEGYIVVKLKSIEPANAATANIKAIGNELSDAMLGDLMSQLANGLSQSYPVSINAEAIDAQF